MMGSLPILEVYWGTPPLMGYKGGLGIWGVYNFIFLLTIFNSMVRGICLCQPYCVSLYCDNDSVQSRAGNRLFRGVF